jgi:hypothetical protein
MAWQERQVRLNNDVAFRLDFEICQDFSGDALWNAIHEHIAGTVGADSDDAIDRACHLGCSSFVHWDVPRRPLDDVECRIMELHKKHRPIDQSGSGQQTCRDRGGAGASMNWQPGECNAGY